MRKFEKIKYEQFIKDIKEDKDLYESFKLPERKTKASSGYDIISLTDGNIKPGDTLLVKTGIKASFNEDEVLFIIIRSSLGFKYGIKIANQIGVIDSDYYSNDENDGHILIKLENAGKEDFKVNLGDRIAQGIFLNYNKVDNEEEIKKTRKGGIGSTNK